MNILHNDIIIRKYKDEERLWVSQRLVMQLCGISEEFLRVWSRASYKKSLKSYKTSDFLPDTGKAWRWARVKDQFYYDYDRIPDRKPTHYRSKLGTKHELLQQYEALLSANKDKKEDIIRNQIVSEVMLLIDNRDIDYYKYKARVTFTHKEAKEMTLAKAWCIWMQKQLENDKFRSLGIIKKQDFYSICTEMLQPLELEGFNISSAEYLRNKVNDFITKTNNDKVKQLDFFISNKYGNTNALIVGKYPIFNEETGEIFQFDIHQAIIYTLFMNPKNPTVQYARTLWENEYREDIQQFGLEPVSYRTFCHHITRYCTNILTIKERYGKDNYRKHVQTYVPSEKLSYSHSLFCADGSGTISYKYANAKGELKDKKLYVMLVTDVASKKIVGWAPAAKGFSSETPQMMMDAVKMAIENTGRQTMFEFISDNHGAFTSKKSEEFLELVFNKVRTIQAGNSQANPAETQFRLFKRSLKDIKSFISTSWDAGIEGQANPDYLKLDDLPTYEDACIMMHNLIKRWNDTRLTDLETPNEKYEQNIHPNCQPMDPIVLRYLFGNKTKVNLRYMRGFVNVYKTKGYNESTMYQFEIPDFGGEGTELLSKATGYKQNVDVNVVWDENAADLYTLEGKYIMTCLPTIKAIQSHAEMTDRHQDALEHHIKRKKSQDQYIEDFEAELENATIELGYRHQMALGGNKESYNENMIENESKKLNNNKQAKNKLRVDRDFNEYLANLGS